MRVIELSKVIIINFLLGILFTILFYEIKHQIERFRYKKLLERIEIIRNIKKHYKENKE